ncbi:uncharacterized protein LOC115693470 isoform X1 [Syzygium oleosum]|uniref:uncharacterized protein LOC115693470 isoform X1 n=1 Tax=Syzygium oleosum TaxID=219896 RepID=UPI0011D290B7|nr:uncharacterized protein LOC115693470 isoform X1 [Syzygium oleosum]
MEPAKIDWKKIESVFVEDDLYEHFDAPKWVDFSSSSSLDPDPDPNHDDDDDAARFFCRPECKHPRTTEDLLKSTPASSSSKLRRQANMYEILPLGDRNQRDVVFKRRGATQSRVPPSKSPNRPNQDSENQNPNLSTPLNLYSITKDTIKSSTEKKKAADDGTGATALPRLRSTLSARNLFAGRDILNQISEFCSELKKLATRTKEKEIAEKQNVVKDVAPTEKEKPSDVLEELGGEGKERKPLLEVSIEKSDGMKKSNTKEKGQRIKRVEEAENVPIKLDLENVRHNEKEILSHIRTNPPTPQCFSATREPGKPTPSKATKSRFMERQILQEVKLNRGAVAKEETPDKGKTVSMVDGRDAKPLAVFWFLKPCTLSS